MNNISVLHAAASWLPQTQTWIYGQIKGLPSDIITHIVCQKTENLDQFKVPNIHCYSDQPLLQRKFYGALRRIGIRQQFLINQVKKYHVQLLHSHFGNVAWDNIIVSQRTKIKHVATFYGYDVNYLPQSASIWKSRYLELFETVDHVLCEGPHMARCIIDLGCSENKVIVHHLGIPINNIYFNPRKWNPHQSLKILMAASFNEKKGIPYALKALEIIGAEQRIEVTIIGDASQSDASRSEKARIIDIVSNTSLKECTRFLGYQPHRVLFEEAYKHDIFIAPSVTAKNGDTEGGAPVSVIEMAATGMPIVSSRHCDIPEVVEDGVTGLLAEERDVHGLVKHLRWLIGNPDKWSSMLQAARGKMETEFDAAKQGMRLARIYRSLI